MQIRAGETAGRAQWPAVDRPNRGGACSRGKHEGSRPADILRKVSRTAVALALLVLSLTAPPLAQGPATGGDIGSWATADLSSLMSVGGIWTPVEPAAIQTGGSTVIFANVVRTGAEQSEGVVLSGWQYNGTFESTMTDPTTVSAAVFEQQPDGTLLDATERLFGNPATTGTGSVLVADFNRDGRDDVFLSSHNESPKLWRPSVAFMSRADGLFTRVDLPDQAANHDARVYMSSGVPKVIASSLGEFGPTSRGGAFQSVYSWNGTNFTVQRLGTVGGLAAAVGPLTPDGQPWIVVGDSVLGPGLPRFVAGTTVQRQYAYRFTNDTASVPPVTLPAPYFNDKPEYAHYVSWWDPASKTHTPRIHIVDINQDGLPDILPFQTIWTSGADGNQQSALQLLLNHGNMQFTDDTDALAPEYNHDSIIDYSMRVADVDGSGIETFLAAGAWNNYPAAKDAIRQANYILVNDGTGKLHAAMHDEFRAMGTQVVRFLRARLPAGTSPETNTPAFIAYRTPNNAINFVAVVRLTTAGRTGTRAWGLVNVATQINLATDFQRDLTIPGRNGSRRIRTFAGNDVIHRSVSDPNCAIDGGLGTNVVAYPGPRANWTITRAGTTVTIAPATGAGGTDTLTRVQIARFSDGDVELAQ